LQVGDSAFQVSVAVFREYAGCVARVRTAVAEV
jgi:hypothetical protein